MSRCDCKQSLPIEFNIVQTENGFLVMPPRDLARPAYQFCGCYTYESFDALVTGLKQLFKVVDVDKAKNTDTVRPPLSAMHHASIEELEQSNVPTRVLQASLLHLIRQHDSVALDTTKAGNCSYTY